ncbi:MAG: 30S ribosomal protein S12 methylthiotransferase RimO [Spirochaetales bacterium]|nr:30S ribosomal protein S12 methylthiotransferase RimO [Spirochaetales bacterium]
MKKIFFIESLGCAKNQVDAEVMIHSLLETGWQRSDFIEEASVVIVNTCGFIKDAKEESIQTGLEIKDLYPDKKVIMTGCLTQRYFDDLSEELLEIDGIMGNHEPQEITRVAEDVLKGSRSLYRPEARGIYHLLPRKPYLSFPGTAYVKIAEGCRNCCSYCSIPIIRGDLRSRSLIEVVKEVDFLLSQGVREINLVAQDLASFGLDRGKIEFLELVKKILDRKDSFWLRLLYIHPDHFPMEILELMKSDKRLLPYFDIPFQHASEPVLNKMGRLGSSEKYLDLIGRIRQEIPDAILRSTFLVGFPGETREDFEILEEFQKQAALEWMGVFCYSREEDTPAFDFKPQVPKKEAEKRKTRLEQAQIDITAARLNRFVGKKLRVLVEEAVKEEDLFLARGFLHAPEVDGLVVIHGQQLVPGDYTDVFITKRNNVDFEASLAE